MLQVVRLLAYKFVILVSLLVRFVQIHINIKLWLPLFLTGDLFEKHTYFIAVR